MLTLSPSAGGLSCGMAPVRAAAGHRPPAFAPGPLITRWRVGHLARQSRAAAAGAAQPTVETDVVVIGAGVGGLSCAGILAKHGLQVTAGSGHGGNYRVGVKWVASSLQILRRADCHTHTLKIR